ncbi:MAG TPA: hypothetical protein VGC76_12415 [Pyrinomonadaceae bacterium]
MSKIFFGEFERKMASRRRISATQNLSYSEILKRQVYLLVKVVNGEESIYRPFRLV